MSCQGGHGRLRAEDVLEVLGVAYDSVEPLPASQEWGKGKHEKLEGEELEGRWRIEKKQELNDMCGSHTIRMCHSFNRYYNLDYII